MTLRILCENDTTAQCESFVIFLLREIITTPNYSV